MGHAHSNRAIRLTDRFAITASGRTEVHELAGQFFTIRVAIQAEDRVISSGPYRLVRHPSYVGLMLIVFGLSLALSDEPAGDGPRVGHRARHADRGGRGSVARRARGQLSRLVPMARSTHPGHLVAPPDRRARSTV